LLWSSREAEVFSGSQLYSPENSTGRRGGAAADGDELLVCPCEVPREGTEREGEAGALAGTAAADGADGWAAADGAGGWAAGSNPSRHGQSTGSLWGKM
jgi:hypothetical protein